MYFSLDMRSFGVRVLCIEPGFFKTNVTDTDALKIYLQKLSDGLPQDVKDDYGHNFLEKGEFLYLSKHTVLSCLQKHFKIKETFNK